MSGPTSRLRLQPESPVHGGAVIAHDGGRPVLVYYAIPGEVVEAELSGRRGGLAYARAAQVREAGGLLGGLREVVLLFFVAQVGLQVETHQSVLSSTAFPTRIGFVPRHGRGATALPAKGLARQRQSGRVRR